MTDTLHLLLLGVALSMTSFALVWAVSVKVNNYGLLDAVWSYSIALLGPVYAAFGTGAPLRKWVAAGMGTAWSLRLGTYILRRVLHHHPKEDPRYRTLRARWPGPGMFLVFFELQALIAVIFSLPFLFAALNPRPALAPVETAGLILAALALAGEALADAQMQRFKASSPPAEAVCTVGLWRFSRHPNYFFESMVWVGFFLFALGSPHGWLAAACPLLMYYFLLRVTGIPLTEKHALESKGDAYREYQRNTSAFIPWFRRSL